MNGSRKRPCIAAAVALAASISGTAPACAEERDPLWVEFRGGLLTVATNGVPLGAVLRAVGEKTGLEVPVVDSSETFTGAFSALPLLDALDRLLARRSYMMRYDEAGQAKELVLAWGDSNWVAPATTAAVAEHTSPAEEEAWISQRLTSSERGDRIVAVRRLGRLPPDRASALGSRVLREESDPVVRAQLAAALGRLEGDGTSLVLTGLLDDPDPSVRIAGARALGRVAGEAAARALGRTLLHGAEPALRQAALESLASRPQDSAKDYLRFVAARSGDPLADAARHALSAGPAPSAVKIMDLASPCLPTAGRPEKVCFQR